MKRTNGFLGILLLLIVVLTSSCRKEEFAFEGSPPEQNLTADSKVAKLLLGVATNDGSGDNIIDGASCISIQLPVTVKINGADFVVEKPEDFDTVENRLYEEDDEDEDDEDEDDDDSDDDDDDDDEQDADTQKSLEIVFPIVVISADFTETTVTDAEALQNLADRCQTANDEDIECVDLKFPIGFSIFNSDTEVFDTATIGNDRALYRLMRNIKANDIVQLDFPVKVITKEGTEIEVVDLASLEDSIDALKGDCNEDDNNNFKDDDCDGCAVEELFAVFADCNEWKAHKFNLGNENIQNQYKDLVFGFNADGTVTAVSNTQTYAGTWSASGSENSITMEVDIAGLDDFNQVWNLSEIKSSNGRQDVRLYIGDDELHFKEGCTGNNP